MPLTLIIDYTVTKSVDLPDSYKTEDQVLEAFDENELDGLIGSIDPHVDIVELSGDVTVINTRTRKAF